ncbi:MAG: mechanosensitive ion channel family protein [Pikeienuella sp.]
MEYIIGLIFNVAFAAAILIGGMLFAGFLKRFIVKQALKYEQLDDTLFVFIGSITRYVVIAVTLIIVLARFGIETTSFIAVLGAAGLAIGLALQGTLSNVAAGVMLMIFRPFKLDQFIEAGGHTGIVKEINLFTTILATLDNVQIIMPNSAVWGGSIVNYSFHDTRRVDLVFGVSYGSDLKKAEKALQGILKDERILDDPETFLKVTNLGDSSVDFTMRAWCSSADYFSLKCDLTRAGKEALDKAKVDIPFPTRTLINVTS